MLALGSREAEWTHTLVALEQRVALATVLAHVCGTRVVCVHGHIAGVQCVIGLQDRRAPQSNLKSNDMNQ